MNVEVERSDGEYWNTNFFSWFFLGKVRSEEWGVDLGWIRKMRNNCVFYVKYLQDFQ